MNGVVIEYLLLTKKERRFRTFGSRGDRPDQMIYALSGIAVDDMDNIYVSSSGQATEVYEQW